MHRLETILGKIEHDVKSLFESDSSGHDVHHLRRTMHLALHIQEKEGGDRLVIAVASFLHDVHRIVQSKTGKYCSPKDSLPRIKRILGKVGLLKKEEIQKILDCIKVHEEYNFSEQEKTAKDIESLIVQDADNLDAMGAVGIARIFAFGGAHDIPIWNPTVPLDGKSDWDETKPKSPSQIHHFYEKLLRLRDSMNTLTGRAMAEGRHKYMEQFLGQFFCEWTGEL